MAFNTALADDTQWGTANEEALARLQFNAFHHSGEAFDAMRLLARSMIDVERKKLDQLVDTVTPGEKFGLLSRPIMNNIRWLSAAINAAVTAQDTWGVVRSISTDDEDAERKIGRALRRMQVSVMANNYDSEEHAWFEEICQAVEAQEYAGLIPEFYAGDDEE